MELNLKLKIPLTPAKNETKFRTLYLSDKGLFNGFDPSIGYR